MEPSPVSILLGIHRSRQILLSHCKNLSAPFHNMSVFSFYHLRQMMPLFCLGFTLLSPSLLLRQMAHSSSSVPSSVHSCLSASLIDERNGTDQSPHSPSITVHNQAASSHTLPSPPSPPCLLSPPSLSPHWVQNGLPQTHTVIHLPGGSSP